MCQSSRSTSYAIRYQRTPVVIICTGSTFRCDCRRDRYSGSGPAPSAGMGQGAQDLGADLSRGAGKRPGSAGSARTSARSRGGIIWSSSVSARSAASSAPATVPPAAVSESATAMASIIIQQQRRHPGPAPPVAAATGGGAHRVAQDPQVFHIAADTTIRDAQLLAEISAAVQVGSAAAGSAAAYLLSGALSFKLPTFSRSRTETVRNTQWNADRMGTNTWSDPLRDQVQWHWDHQLGTTQGITMPKRRLLGAGTCTGMYVDQGHRHRTGPSWEAGSPSTLRFHRRSRHR